MAKPESDHRSIDASLKKLHSRGVAQNMGRDPFPLQRRARLPRDIYVFGKHVLDCIGAESPRLTLPGG